MKPHQLKARRRRLKKSKSITYKLSKFSDKYPERCLLGVHYEKINHVKYKYKIIKEISYQTEFTGSEVENKYFHLEKSGMLTIKVGYLSDGPSGPTIDTASFMRGAFFHDVCYQLLRMGKLVDSLNDFNDCRLDSDLLLDEICKADGMCFFRRRWVYRGLRVGGKSSALPNYEMVS